MTIQQIKDLVSAGKLSQACQEANNLAQQLKDSSNGTALAMLQGKLAQLERDNNLGLISFDDAARTRAQISYGLLNILSGLQPAAVSNTILFLASNPKATAKLQLEQECSKISEAMQDFPAYSVKSRFAVTPDLVINALTDYKPGIIHFSGHGQGTGYDGTRASGVPAASQDPAEGIVLQNDAGDIQIATGEQLRRLFEAFNNAAPISLVFLNACHSASQAQIIHTTVPYVIGMNAAVPDAMAIAFAARFYRTLGSGNTIPNAFNISKAAMSFEGLTGDSIPVLYQPA